MNPLSILFILEPFCANSSLKEQAAAGAKQSKKFCWRKTKKQLKKGQAGMINLLLYFRIFCSCIQNNWVLANLCAIPYITFKYDP